MMRFRVRMGTMGYQVQGILLQIQMMISPIPGKRNDRRPMLLRPKKQLKLSRVLKLLPLTIRATVKDNAAQTMKQIGANTENTCFAAGFILCGGNCKLQAATILEMRRPIWSAHSQHATECRNPDGVLEYYQLSAAATDYMNVLQRSAEALLNMTILAKIGFLTEFGSLPKTANTIDPLVQADTANAFTMVDLFCCMASHWISSMLWHSRAYPGYLALLTCPDNDTYEKAFKQLVKDFEIYNKAVEIALASTYIAKAIQSSLLKRRW